VKDPSPAHSLHMLRLLVSHSIFAVKEEWLVSIDEHLDCICASIKSAGYKFVAYRIPWVLLVAKQFPTSTVQYMKS
jgi:hypothetical protein